MGAGNAQSATVRGVAPPTLMASKCMSTTERVKEDIEQLLTLSYGDGPAEILGRLRKAECLAANTHPNYANIIARRLQLQYGDNLAVVQEALDCIQRGELREYSDTEQANAMKNLQICVRSFQRQHPGQLLLQSELVRSLELLQTIVTSSEHPTATALQKEADELDSLATLLGGYGGLPAMDVMPIKNVDAKSFEMALKISQELQTELLRGAAADSSELWDQIHKEKGTPEKAEREFYAENKIKKKVISSIYQLDRSAWIWNLWITQSLSSSLLAAGSSDLPRKRRVEFLTDNIDIWQQASDSFVKAGHPAAQGLSELNLAIAYRKLGESRKAIEHGKQAIEKLSPFALRGKLLYAVQLVSSELVLLGRTTDASAILFDWFAKYGGEAKIFDTPSPKVNPVLKELQHHYSDMNAQLASVFESEGRYVQAENFRRVSVDSAALSANSQKLQLAIYDLAINLAIQGRNDEAVGVLRRNSPVGGGDWMDAAMNNLSWAERAAKLALIMDRPNELERAIKIGDDAGRTTGIFAFHETSKALLLASKGKTGEAIAVLKELIVDAAIRGKDDRHLSYLRAELARVLVSAGDTAAAIAVARQSLHQPQTQ